MSELLEQIKRIRNGVQVASHREGHAAQVYAECNKLLAQHPDNVQLLVYKSQLIQMMSDGSEVLLENARDALKKALSIDPNYIPALIELGWFIFAHDDNAKRASKYFLKAMKLANSYANDCVRWIKDCFLEMRLKKGHGHKEDENEHHVNGGVNQPNAGLCVSPGELEKN